MTYEVIQRKTDFNGFNIISSQEDLRPIFKEIVLHNPSDIYFQEGSPIFLKINGDTRVLDKKILTSLHMKELASLLAVDTSAESIVKSGHAINSIFRVNISNTPTNNSYENLQKYRVNISATTYCGRSTFQIVLRTIPNVPPRYDEIGLSEEYVRMCCPNDGIVLIAGVTGSGKSTTMASKVRYILENDTCIKGNIVEHGEPLEYTYEQVPSTHSFVNQSQIPQNFKSFADANREAMRRKPALIIVGELRDNETISSAVEATLTGHPVYATVHAGTVDKIIPRMVAQFPTDEKSTALFNIISSISVLIAQRLVKKTNGKLMAVREFLHFTDSVKEMLLQLPNENEVTNKIREIMKSGSLVAMEDASEIFSIQGNKLYEKGIITRDACFSLGGNPS